MNDQNSATSTWLGKPAPVIRVMPDRPAAHAKRLTIICIVAAALFGVLYALGLDALTGQW